MIFALGVLTGIAISVLAAMWFLKDFKVYR